MTLKHESRERMWRDYTAVTMWGVGKCLGGDNWTIPEYIKLMYGEQTPVGPNTADEVINHIRKELE